jgi:hypothetical protein
MIDLMVPSKYQKWSGHAHDPTHTDLNTGKKNFFKIFYFRTETGRVKKIMVL